MQMKSVFTGLLLICSLSTLTGCAAPKKADVPGQSVYVNTVSPEKESEIISLECRSAHRLGCRHKGRVYPWNAWVELKGYNANQYDIRDVKQSGNQAVVLVVKKK